MEDPSPRSARSGLGRWLPAGEVALIWAVFFIHAGWAPPEVNEAHYLSKAKHYWDPAWCQNDFFCNTADAHQVFYWTFGWLTRLVSLPAAAWCGRAVAWTLLACGWYQLSRALVPRPWYAVLSAALFVALNDRCQMAGEWVVGGIEAKGIAYAIVFFALAALVRGEWTKTWLLLGAASAFHVLVGGWAVVAAGIVWLAAGSERPPVGRTLLALCGGLVLALPGLLPAWWLTAKSAPDTVAVANQIYVFQRLEHHLVATSFLDSALVRFTLMLLFWCTLCWVGPRGPRETRLRWFVTGSLAIAACGAIISLNSRGHEALAAGLLRFYWFRLSDAMLPTGTALAAVGFVAAMQRLVPPAGARWLLVAVVAAGLHLGDVLQYRWTYPSPRADWSVDDPEAWWEICDWIAVNTPEDAVFMTPRMASTFRWYTGRAEVVNWKDVPQDAGSLVAWWRRIDDLHRLPGSKTEWRSSLASAGAEKLTEVGRKYGANYVVTSAYRPLALLKVSPPNRTYAVYQLPRK